MRGFEQDFMDYNLLTGFNGLHGLTGLKPLKINWRISRFEAD